MSLSDIENNAAAGPDTGKEDGFKPINLSSLDSFDGEISQKTPETEPDFDRFKLLFDHSEMAEEDVSFDALYAFTKEDREGVFEPLIEGTGTAAQAAAAAALAEADAPEMPEQETEPEKTPEELGFERGYQEGMAQGREQGLVQGEAKGYEDGFAKGEAEGLEKGQAQGMEKGEAEGIEKGMAEGRQKAEAEVRDEAGQVLEPLKQSLESADKLLDRLLKRYETQIIELVYKIAEKAVLAKLETDDEVVRHTVMDALSHLVAPEEITLSVSAEDYEYVEMIKEEFFEAVRSLKHVAVNSDTMIPKGGCRIESSAATISTDPESKLAMVYDAIVKAGRS